MIEIIPAIDIIDGECVRLSQGDYNQKKSYYKDPLEVAKMYEGIGLTRLHIVDLDGAKMSEPQNLKVVERITRSCNLKVQFGGGIKNNDAISRVFDAGVTYAICGSIAITSPDTFTGWLEKYGEGVILGADIKDGNVAINGWLEGSTMSVEDVINKFKDFGLKRVICTDISKDGMLQGPNFSLYESLQSAYTDIDITVSGGISCFDDIVTLNDMNLRSVIVGKAIYENFISIKQIEEWLQKE
ncbi:MAG: 1-(5-phosphoribosyl)-5-[(5-phosphoribosylamino)methylideneamino]imidazole-4-carboxamide isomerase [Rikenellaceae bacterium]